MSSALSGDIDTPAASAQVAVGLEQKRMAPPTKTRNGPKMTIHTIILRVFVLQCHQKTDVMFRSLDSPVADGFDQNW
jgi:hypothetical protein